MKVVLLGSFDGSLVNFRGPLIRAMVQEGHEVIGAAPAQTEMVPRQLKEMGAGFAPIRLAPTGLNPFADYLCLRLLTSFFSRERPDAVLAYTIKAIGYGAIAARRAGVKRFYALVTGLGAAFHTTGVKGWLLRTAAMQLYRRSLPLAERVFVQNADIGSFLVRERLVQMSRVVRVAGSGVDVAYYAHCPVPRGGPVFVLMARLLRDKGLWEYVEAARRVRQEFPTAECWLVGAPDSNPAAVPLREVERWAEQGDIKYMGYHSDVRPILEACTTYVLPSYHEGVPRSVLEAMAIGRAIITTDTIGCRDTIRDAVPGDGQRIRWGRNGALVPVKDASALAAAMLLLARNPDIAAEMGCASREFVEEVFDVNAVNRQMLDAMGLLKE